MSAWPRAVAGIAIAAALALGSTLATAAPATAHDQLLESSPAPGERLAEPPREVELRFSSEILSLGDTGALVRVVDAEGHDWALGGPQIDRELVTAALDPAMPTDAGYLVQWQVVSSDGHAISGTIPFVVGDGQPVTAAAPSPSAPSPAPDDEQAASAPGETGAPVWLRPALVGLSGAATALALLAVVALVRRRRPHPADGDDQKDNR